MTFYTLYGAKLFECITLEMHRMFNLQTTLQPPCVSADFLCYKDIDIIGSWIISKIKKSRLLIVRRLFWNSLYFVFEEGRVQRLISFINVYALNVMMC